MRRNHKPLLILGQSGRALAASAKKAGLKVHVIDRYADTDTQSLAISCQSVSGFNGKMESNHVRKLLASFPDDKIAGVIIGSGLEDATEIIAEIQEKWCFFGNRAEVWDQCNDPVVFSGLLKQLGIRHPEISLEQPVTSAGWLVKQGRAAGGWHVHRMDDAGPCGENTYYQQYLEGHHVSAVFLADSSNVMIVGTSDTAVVNREKGDFRFAGAVISATITPFVEQQLLDIITRLVNHFALHGLCGIDVVIDEHDRCWLLELNPRPTASFELFERDESLLAAHIAGCQGQLPASLSAEGCQGLQVLYTAFDLCIPAMDWPDWISDRPVPGQLISAGNPVCVIHAKADEYDRLQEELQTRSEWLTAQFHKQHQAA